jgi:hypothetical protein
MLKNIQKKCEELWFVTKPARIRRREKIFLPEEEEIILSTNKWTYCTDFKEKVMLLAFNIYEPLKCPITNNIFSYKKPLYRLHYTDAHIRNRCFMFKKNTNIIKNIYTDYNINEIETILRNTKPTQIIQYPLLINHCFVMLKKAGINIDEITSSEEACYLYAKNYTNIPKCPITGKNCVFKILSNKYTKFASTEVSHIANGLKNKNKKRSIEAIRKQTETLITKYGAKSAFNIKGVYERGLQVRRANAVNKKINKEHEKSLDIRTTEQKRLDTIKIKYGVSSIKEYHKKYPLSVEKTFIRKEKQKESCIKKYGVSNIGKVKSVRDKIKDTCILKYGDLCALNTDEQKERRAHNKKIDTYINFKRFANICMPMFTLEEWILKCEEKLPWKKIKTGEIFDCKYYGYPPVGRFKGTTLEETIYDMLDILSVEYIKHDRTIIAPQEIDIYIPSIKLGIECNGEYFHSEISKSASYHIDKTNSAKKAGVRLIHFFGKHITQNSKVVYNILRSIIKGNNIKIAARKCEIVNLSQVTARNFFEKYHLSGFCGAKIHLGLMYKNRLISALSVGKDRFNKNNELEIIRYAIMNNVTVVGGFEKLLSQIKRIYTGVILHTYADINVFTGNVYRRAGFNFVNTTPPDYYYAKGCQYLSRYKTQKHKLNKLLKDKFNKNETEEENMKRCGFYKVYGCGSTHYTIQL